MREKISAFVISYNRAALLESCLRAASFADELIVIDKSSTDGSAAAAARHADRVEVVPWSPTVEDTRAFALSLCRHDWILFLDDDEILSPESGPVLRQEIDRSDVDIFAIPLRHYILGVHDERACYWPEAHHRLFRKGAISFIPTVHGGSVFHSGKIDLIPVESGVCIHHLSHPDVASFIERTNRYTSRADRARLDGGARGLADFARERIEYWLSRASGGLASEYCDAVALLRATYEIVDRLKAWEETRGLDGAELFRIAQRELAAATDRDGGAHAASRWAPSI